MKKVITIGFEIPGFSEDFYSFNSPKSLLDADIIIFCPRLACYHYYESFQGKPEFNQDTSFQLKEDSFYWHKEISTALQEGKTVFIVISRYEEVYVHSGRTEYSGTGRSARATNILEPFSNYRFLPVELPKLMPKEGTEIVFNGDPIFASFWNEMKEYLIFESYIDGKIESPLFFTKTGNKPIGGIFKLGKGNLVLLPQIEYPDNFTVIKNEGKENAEELWNKEAIQFGKRIIQIFIDIDSALKRLIETTPPPEWAHKAEYRIAKEANMIKSISKISSQIESLSSEKSVLVDKLQKEGFLRGLLYEKGKPLETAIKRALEMLGYKAEKYEDGNLEIDQIIVSPEGNRFIGEAEGKDNAAINIDKFRQLESNIQEDLQREEVKEAAIGILFGNGYRLVAPELRQEQFTDKCIINAVRLNVTMIRTIDLFKIAKYVRESNNMEYARECRSAIINNRGRIASFPDMPRD